MNKLWKQQPTKQQLYRHLLSISQTIPVRRSRHVRHSSRSKDELISDVLLWTPTYWRTSVGRPVKSNIWSLRTLDAFWRTKKKRWMNIYIYIYIVREREKERERTLLCLRKLMSIAGFNSVFLILDWLPSYL